MRAWYSASLAYRLPTPAAMRWSNSATFTARAVFANPAASVAAHSSGANVIGSGPSLCGPRCVSNSPGSYSRTVPSPRRSQNRNAG